MALKDPEGIFGKLLKRKFMQETTTTHIFTFQEIQREDISQMAYLCGIFLAFTPKRTNIMLE